MANQFSNVWDTSGVSGAQGQARGGDQILGPERPWVDGDLTAIIRPYEEAESKELLLAARNGDTARPSPLAEMGVGQK